jgi:hypothetical protein
MKRIEDKIQQEIFTWFWNNYCLKHHQPREIMYHVPNEGKDNGKLVSIGLYPGCSDLIFTWRGQHLYCEIKTPTGSQSPNQKKFQSHVEQCGYKYVIIRSLKEFQEFCKINLHSI